MALAGNDRALLTCRVGCARIGAVRIGFVPKHTTGVANAFYIWWNRVGMTSQKPAGVWTARVR